MNKKLILSLSFCMIFLIPLYPQITDHPDDSYVCPGSSVTLSVAYSSPGFIVWSYRFYDITGTPQTQLITGANSPSYTVSYSDFTG